MPAVVRHVRFATAECFILPDHMFSLFSDGLCASLELLKGDNDHYRGVARWAGYGEDWRRYAVEHDLIHSWLADRTSRAPSLALRLAAQGLEPRGRAERAAVDFEESCVNGLARLLQCCDVEPAVLRRLAPVLPAIDDLRRVLAA